LRVNASKSVLLIVTGGIAAYKTLELVRRLVERGISVTPVLTEAGAAFVTPLSLAALSKSTVYRDLFSLTDETEMGHIELSRQADLVVVAPATADCLAKLAAGLANDLASTLLLATDKPVMAAPAMNVRMWEHPATRANLEILQARDVLLVGPNEGSMACGEYGFGRMAEPEELLAAIEGFFERSGLMSGRRALVTSGPTHEPIDPVRFIGNRSSGKQGHAIAAALAQLGAQTTLVSGPTHLPDPAGVSVVHVETAEQMLTACRAVLPVHVAVCAAAVGDWRVKAPAAGKIKKTKGKPPAFAMVENPDVLASLAAAGNERPDLLIGFAAETENIVEHARAKLQAKGCDWILANDVSPERATFGGADNQIHVLRGESLETWPRMSKVEAARRLAAAIAEELGPQEAA
jgi:phosphopantothenoylcysteine decarboxylase/phosphopantothenate--cysteine ligase